MLISVIITTYKHEKFIDKTIDSIIQQTYSDREILIGDDSPDDATWCIIKKYVKKYPNKIHARHHEKSLGIVKNLEFLIEKLNKKTEYVAFLEGDDVYMNNNLENKLKIFNSNKNIALVYNECSIINEYGEVTTKYFLKSQGCNYFYHNEKIDLSNTLCSLTPIYHSWSTIMVRFLTIQNYKITIPNLENHSLVSDFFFFFNVGSNESIYGIKEPLTGYRVHSNNLSSSVNNSLSNDLLQVFSYYYEQGLITKNVYNKGKVICHSTLFLSFLKNAFKYLIFSLKENFFFTFKVIIYKLATFLRLKKK